MDGWEAYQHVDVAQLPDVLLLLVACEVGARSELAANVSELRIDSRLLLLLRLAPPNDVKGKILPLYEGAFFATNLISAIKFDRPLGWLPKTVSTLARPALNAI